MKISGTPDSTVTEHFINNGTAKNVALNLANTGNKTTIKMAIPLPRMLILKHEMLKSHYRQESRVMEVVWLQVHLKAI